MSSTAVATFSPDILLLSGMNIKRYPDWAERLSRFIAERRDHPFAWGTQDCCLFAADAVYAITGTDLATDFRGYQDKDEALALVQRYGGLAPLADTIAAQHQLKTVSPRLAHRGDICLFEATFGQTLGICIGADMIAPGGSGLVTIPLNKALKAWRV